MEFLLVSTRSERASASEAIFSWSKFVVGSSNAITPQLELNVSANDRRIIRDAKTYGKKNKMVKKNKKKKTKNGL